MPKILVRSPSLGRSPAKPRRILPQILPVRAKYWSKLPFWAILAKNLRGKPDKMPQKKEQSGADRRPIPTLKSRIPRGLPERSEGFAQNLQVLGKTCIAMHAIYPNFDPNLSGSSDSQFLKIKICQPVVLTWPKSADFGQKSALRGNIARATCAIRRIPAPKTRNRRSPATPGYEHASEASTRLKNEPALRNPPRFLFASAKQKTRRGERSSRNR